MSSSASDSSATVMDVPLSFVLATGCATVVCASVLAYVLLDTHKKKLTSQALQEEAQELENSKIPVDKEMYPGGLVSVYYASQTGTAEAFAKQLEREAPDHGFLLSVVDLEDIDVENLVDENRKDETSGKARAIFLTATYGEGESPDNSINFVNALKEKAGTDGVIVSIMKPDEMTNAEVYLEDLEYGVFGLGNKQYDHFNSMGKFFDFVLERSGAKRILPLGMGDDDDDIEADFESWKDKEFWPSLKKKYLTDSLVRKLKDTNGKVAQKLPECPYQIVYHTKDIELHNTTSCDQVHSSAKHFFSAALCPVTLVRELRQPEDPGSTVHVEIDISKAKGVTYETADNLGVLPVNDSDVVESVAKSLGYDLDAIFSVKAAPDQEWHGAPFPMPCTVRECLSHYLDLTGAPRRAELKLLATYAKDPIDKKFLLRIASQEGRTEYKEKVIEGYVGVVNLLQACPSISLPLEHFLSFCEKMQTRFYTISSSSAVHPNTVHLTVSVTKAKRKDGSTFKGVCSNHLAGCASGEGLVRIFNRPSTFNLPADSTKPIIMIGPGTGVAPMRAFLQERAYQKTKLNKRIGKSILYFGCKSRAQDFVYQEELEAYLKSGVLDQLNLAFSREQEKKVYVQHLLLENRAETWKLIKEEDAYVYTCGGVKMGHDVSETIKDIFVSEGMMQPDAAKQYLADLSHEGRFVQELWA